MIFGGVIEDVAGEPEVTNAFISLDLRSWHATKSEVARETWKDFEERYREQVRRRPSGRRSVRRWSRVVNLAPRSSLLTRPSTTPP